MRKLVKPGQQPEFWQNIVPQQLAQTIEGLPAIHDLYFLAKLVAEGYLRPRLSGEQQIGYARTHEGLMRYLTETQDEDDVLRHELLYIPFCFSISRVFPTMTTLSFAHGFQQFLRFVSPYPPSRDPDEVFAVVELFVQRLKLG